MMFSVSPYKQVFKAFEGLLKTLKSLDKVRRLHLQLHVSCLSLARSLSAHTYTLTFPFATSPTHSHSHSPPPTTPTPQPLHTFSRQVRKASTKTQSSRASLPLPPSLSGLLVSATHSLLGNIVAAFEDSSKHSDRDTSAGAGASQCDEGELVGWLVFGCGFINAVMVLVGDVKDGRMEELVATFVALEGRLNK